MGLLAASCCFLLLASVSAFAREEDYKASSKCGGEVVVDDEVTLRSPGFPNKYGKKEVCRWKLVAKDANAVLEMNCPKFDLQSSKKCTKDRLIMVQDKKEVKRFCGKGLKTFAADSGKLEVVFRSNRWVSRNGFECTVRTRNDAATSEGYWSNTGDSSIEPPTTKVPATKPPTTKPPTGSKKCQCGVPNLNRIVNGVTVDPAHKYPWHAGLKYNTGSSYWCGGTVINNKYVLTAAHCFFDQFGERASDEGLVVGVADHDMTTTTDDVSGVTKMVKVKKVTIHPNYDVPKGSVSNDIALLLLEDTLDLSKNKALRAVCLPKDDSKDYAGMTGIATGWGRLVTDGRQPNKLHEVELPILPQSCWGHAIKDVMMCAAYKNGEKDTCQGDSGGPLYVKEDSKFVQVGITSFGMGDCAVANSPGVYARVSKFLSWIKQNTADATYCD